MDAGVQSSYATPGTAEFSAVYFFCLEDSNCCALLNHNLVVSLTLVRLHARLSCASPPASLTDESLMHMASEAIQCEFGIIVGKLLLALEVAKCRHRSTHGARRQEPPNFRRFIFCPEDSNCCALLNHNLVVSLTLVRLHARLSCASPPASLTDESLMLCQVSGLGK